MERQYNMAPQHGQIFDEKLYNTSSGKPIRRTVQVSDIIFSQYKSINSNIRQLPIRQMQIRSKALDKPIPFFKSLFASIANIKKQHQFLYFQTDKFMITVDYYIQNRLVIRMGDEEMVLDSTKSQMRRNARILKETSGLQWRRVFRKQVFNVGQLLDYIFELKMYDYSQALYNGSHYSRFLFKEIQKKLINQ